MCVGWIILGIWKKSHRIEWRQQESDKILQEHFNVKHEYYISGELSESNFLSLWLLNERNSHDHLWRVHTLQTDAMIYLLKFGICYHIIKLPNGYSGKYSIRNSSWNLVIGTVYTIKQYLNVTHKKSSALENRHEMRMMRIYVNNFNGSACLHQSIASSESLNSFTKTHRQGIFPPILHNS